MKINELQKALKKRKIDFAVFYNGDGKGDPNFIYFSGYAGYGFLIVPSRRKPFLIVPEMETAHAKKTGIKSYTPENVNVIEVIKNYAKNPRKMGIDEANFSVLMYKKIKKSFGAEIVSITDLCSEIRMTKTKKEIELIKKACSISDRIFMKCLNNFKKFRYETDVASFIQNEASKIGVDCSFKTLVSSGKNSSLVHHEPEKTKIKKGFFIIDYGIKYKNYCSDTTRTIYIGTPSKKDKEIYTIVLNAMTSAIKNLKIGRNFSEIHGDAVKKLGKYSKNFIHSLGHGIGIEVHEPPKISGNSKDLIKENMIFTIEPGVYFANKFGIRIEDDVLMMRKGAVVLTKAPKKLLNIKL